MTGHSQHGADMDQLQPELGEQTKLKSRIMAMCEADFSDVFAEPQMPPSRTLDHRIELRDSSKAPPKLRQFRLSHSEQAEVKKQVS